MPHARFSTLVEALLAAPPDRPFITMWCDEDESDTVTFGEFIRLAQAQAANLRDQGLRAGNAVVLVMPQGIPLMEAFADWKRTRLNSSHLGIWYSFFCLK